MLAAVDVGAGRSNTDTVTIGGDGYSVYEGTDTTRCSLSMTI